MFRKQSDFEAFERVMVEAHQRQPIRILSCKLDGSCQRAFDLEGARPSASQHRERTTLRRGRMGAANSEGSRVGAHRSPGGPADEPPHRQGDDRHGEQEPSDGEPEAE
jgi:hypothetical protein